VNIGLLAQGATGLEPDTFTVVEEYVDDDCGDRSKGQPVGDSKRDWEEEWAISLICLNVQVKFWADNTCHVVNFARIVKGFAADEGQVCGVPNVGILQALKPDALFREQKTHIKDCRQYPIEYDNAYSNVRNSPPWTRRT